MCRPSCCKPSNEGAGIAAVAVIASAAVVAVKIGPVVARITHLVVEVLTIIMLTAVVGPGVHRAGLADGLHRALAAAPPFSRTRRRRCSWFHPVPETTSDQADTEPGCLACGDTGTVLRAISGSRYQAQPCPACEPVTAGRVITMPQHSPRNHRNNPYVLDRAFAQVHHSAAGTIWRFRTELAVLAAATAGCLEIRRNHHCGLDGDHLHRVGPDGPGVAVDPAVHHPPGLVRAVPPPHPAGLL